MVVNNANFFISCKLISQVEHGDSSTHGATTPGSSVGIAVCCVLSADMSVSLTFCPHNALIRSCGAVQM